MSSMNGMSNMKQIDLSPRQFAVLRHVWKLDASEQNLLDKYFLLKIPAAELAQKLDEYAEVAPIAVRDHVKHQTMYLELEWMNTGAMEVDTLAETAPNTMFLLSVRINYMSGFSVALVRKAEVRDTLTTIPDVE